MSPFVKVFEGVGIPAAAGIINFVVITAAVVQQRHLQYRPDALHAGAVPLGASRLRESHRARHVPATAITFSAALMLIGVALNYVVPEEVFIWVTSVALVGSLRGPGA